MAIPEEKLTGAVSALEKRSSDQALSIKEIAGLLHVNSKSIRRHFDTGLQGELKPLPYVKNEQRLYERPCVHKFLIFLCLADVLQYTHARSIDFIRNSDLVTAWNALCSSPTELDKYFFDVKNGQTKADEAKSADAIQDNNGSDALPEPTISGAGNGNH